MTSIGLGVGAVAAALVGKLIRGSLYGVAAFDPITAALSSLTIVAAAVLAGWLPARRASRVDPMNALRVE